MRRILVLLGAVAAWAYGQSTTTGSRTMVGSWDASGALSTKPMRAGTALPGTCSTGEAFFNTSAASGQNLYLCKPDNAWTQVTTGGGSSATVKELVFDGSTTITGESMTSWSCGSGSGATCTTQWTIPTGLTWVRVQTWGGGAGGGGSVPNQKSQSGGSGGGYGETVCPVTPGTQVTVTVGLGGAGMPDGYQSDANFGGNSSFGTCVRVQGGGGSGNYGGIVAWAGRLYGMNNQGWFVGATLRDPTLAYCTTGGLGASASAPDQGGCGGGSSFTSGLAGIAGGSGYGGGGGGGSGGLANATGGAGGASVFGGAGGNGGGWTSGGGLVACVAGAIPGGGGGSAGAEGPGGSVRAGCGGARGEVRVFYTK